MSGAPEDRCDWPDRGLPSILGKFRVIGAAAVLLGVSAVLGTFTGVFSSRLLADSSPSSSAVKGPDRSTSGAPDEQARHALKSDFPGVSHSPLPPAPLGKMPASAIPNPTGDPLAADEAAPIIAEEPAIAEELDRDLPEVDTAGATEHDSRERAPTLGATDEADVQNQSLPTGGPANSKDRPTKTTPSGRASRAVHKSESSPKPEIELSSASTDVPNSARLAKLFRGSPPTNREELRTLQARIRELTPRIIPATVAIQVGRANGSGVIIDPEGHVLTAAHVAGTPGRRATVFLADGKAVAATTLGMNQQLDAGMIKITDEGPWPHAPLGRSADVRDGQWCLATGHPGGYDPNRPPVLRWGRVLKTDESAILSDCTLVGGDSGGPLYDLQGRVIGIHSRIGKNLTINVHVPIDPYRESWDRLVRSESWGPLESSEGGPAPAWLGVVEDPRSAGATIEKVAPGSPAAEAGILAGDQITHFNDKKVESFEDLQKFVRESSPGTLVRVRLARDNTLVDLQLTLTARPEASAD